MNDNKELIKQLNDLLNGGNAHASFDDAVADIKLDDLSKIPGHLPYSIWQLTEHLRIAQWDILEFSKSSEYKSPKWPDEYWPKEKGPASEKAWKDCLSAIEKDRNEFIELLKNSDDIYKPFEHGDGQSLLKEALVIADHNSYHTAEIIIIRRLLGIWKN